MSEAYKPEKKLKVVSLTPRVIYVEKDKYGGESSSLNEEEVIVAPFFINEEEIIEDLSELIDKVYQEFSQACEQKNLNWEAELELGIEFGVKFNAKLKIAPKT
jgi:hypothetical protein